MQLHQASAAGYMECVKYLVEQYQTSTAGHNDSAAPGSGGDGLLALEGPRRMSFMPLDGKQRTPLDIAREFKKEKVAMYLELLSV